jgi:uncharacterized membrane protein YedE/YeeE
MKPLLPVIVSVIVGLVFGIGLIVSGMFNPAKVLAFLDVARAWDPSLALVMAGAVAMASIGFAMADRRGTTLLGATPQLGSARNIDRRLVLGSLAFGVGWGLVGFCPGPALVALGTGEIKASVFVAGMAAGMLVFNAAERRRRSGPESVVPERIQSTTADG